MTFKKNKHELIIMICLFSLAIIEPILIGVYFDIDIMSAPYYSLILFLTAGIEYLIIKYLKNRKLAFYAMCFFIFHFLIFPNLYIYLYHSSPKNILIDESTIEIEKNENLNELNKIYKPSDFEINNDILSYLILEKNSLLDSLIDFKKNVRINNYEIKIIEPPRRKPLAGVIKRTPDNFHENKFKITSKENNYIYISELLFPKKSLRENFKASLIGNKNKETEYLALKSKVIKGKTFSYHNILFYSLNIFNTDTIKPISKIANIIYFLHYVIVYVFIITFLVNAIEIKKK